MMECRPPLAARFALAALAALALTSILPAPAPAAEGAAPQTAKFAEIPATAATLEALRAGGFVLYLRHGTTDNARPDRVPVVDFADCSSQRPLTEEGRQLAARVGDAIRQRRIPIGEIRSSPLCRARDSAAAAFPDRSYTVDEQLMYTANLTDGQKAPIIANTRRLLSAPVAAGTNRLLVAHAPNLMDLIGYFPKECTLVVFQPRGEAGFEYVASIPPSLWSEWTD
jgi:phosphohistidine phosphatase SixA